MISVRVLLGSVSDLSSRITRARSLSFVVCVAVTLHLANTLPRSNSENNSVNYC